MGAPPPRPHIPTHTQTLEDDGEHGEHGESGDGDEEVDRGDAAEEGDEHVHERGRDAVLDPAVRVLRVGERQQVARPVSRGLCG